MLGGGDHHRIAARIHRGLVVGHEPAQVVLDEPMVLSVPDTSDRYYVVNVFNMWQELEHYIGRRTTGTKAARYVLVPPAPNGGPWWLGRSAPG